MTRPVAVFRDLGFEFRDVKDSMLQLYMYSDLLHSRAHTCHRLPVGRLKAEIKPEMKRQKLTRREAAELFAVSQPRMSDLVRGKIDLFSIETLINMLVRTGIRVQLHLMRSRHARNAEAA